MRVAPLAGSSVPSCLLLRITSGSGSPAIEMLANDLELAANCLVVDTRHHLIEKNVEPLREPQLAVPTGAGNELQQLASDQLGRILAGVELAIHGRDCGSGKRRASCARREVAHCDVAIGQLTPQRLRESPQ